MWWHKWKWREDCFHVWSLRRAAYMWYFQGLECNSLIWFSFEEREIFKCVELRNICDKVISWLTPLFGTSKWVVRPLSMSLLHLCVQLSGCLFWAGLFVFWSHVWLVFYASWSMWAWMGIKVMSLSFIIAITSYSIFDSKFTYSTICLFTERMQYGCQ